MIPDGTRRMLRMALACGALLYLTTSAVAQAGSLLPGEPRAGGRVVLRYDTSHAKASLSGKQDVFATLQIVASSGTCNRSVDLRAASDGVLQGAVELPEDAVFLLVTFASRRQVDWSAHVRSLVYDEQGEPVRGARCHVALAARDRCLAVLDEELAAHPDCYEVYRYRWAYNRLFRRGQFGEDEIRKDLAQIGSAATPAALLARVYLHMMCGQEAEARAALLSALDRAPKAWATVTALGDYQYFARANAGMNAGAAEVESAVCRTMLANPDSQLVREHLYNYWMKFDFESVRNLTDAWLATEPRNPLPHAILAAASLARRSHLDAGGKAAVRAMNGFLRGDGRIASVDTQYLEQVYLDWSCIAAAKLAEARGDLASAISYAKTYVACAGDGVEGHVLQAEMWEQLNRPGRARDSWLDALEHGSVKAKAALRSLWLDETAGDARSASASAFESHLAVMLQSRRSASERVKAPLFSCEDLAGTEVDSQSLHGRVVVMNFWGLGCMPCKKEIPALNELARSYDGKPVTFLAFSSDRAAAVKDYLATHDFSYRQVAEAGGVARSFDVSSLPLHVVLDGQGRVIAKLSGAGPGQPARIASLVDLALAEL